MLQDSPNTEMHKYDEDVYIKGFGCSGTNVAAKEVWA